MPDCEAVACTTGTDSVCLTCQPGFERIGDACGPIDDCVGAPCGNGSCIDGFQGYACDCPVGWFDDGTTCAACAPIANCATVTCGTTKGSLCSECEKGFEALSGACHEIDDCLAGVCGNGTCADQHNGYRCDCPEGEFFDGTTCVMCDSVANCDTVTCTNRTDERCTTCAAGYEVSGATCRNIDDCVAAPCGTGTCVDGLQSYRCNCPAGEYDDGTTCVACQEIAHCAARECATADDSACTVCQAGYELVNGACADIDDCAGNPCGSGTCTDDVGGYRCACGPAAYDSGTTCVACPGLDHCTATQCTTAHDSVCTNCQPGYQVAGGRCVDVDDCAGISCGNGSCVDLVNGYRCECPAGEYDAGGGCASCATVANCDAVTCSTGTNSMCTRCSAGFDLLNGGCTVVNDCPPDACGPGVCIDGANTYTCDCTGTGYEGAACDVVSDCDALSDEALAREPSCWPDGSFCKTALTLEATSAGDTRNAGNQVAMADYCGAQGTGMGDQAADQVWRYTAPADGLYRIAVQADHAAIVWVTSSCTADGAGCEAAWTADGSGRAVTLQKQVPVNVFVDGADGAEGSYTITVERIPEADCDDRIDDDGDGATDCEDSDCAADPACTIAPTCVVESTIDTFPAHIVANSAAANDDFSLDHVNGCFDWAAGAAVPDHTYALIPDVSATYTITLTAAFDATLTLFEDCAEVDTCLAGSDTTLTGVEAVEFELVGGTRYYVIVDGYQAGDAGSYELTVEQPCMPDCSGQPCQADGCGGVCETCPNGELCGGDGQCTANLTQACMEAVSVDSLPFFYRGNTSEDDDDFVIAPICAGGGTGEGDPDAAFRFTPPSSGLYRITMPGFVPSGPSLITVTGNCGDVILGCVDGADFFAADDPVSEGLVVDLEQGATVWIILDGPAGPYQLSVAAVCQPQCEGKVCGPDSCGGVCGGCGADQACAPAGVCQASDGTVVSGVATYERVRPTDNGLDYANPEVLPVRWARAVLVEAATGVPLQEMTTDAAGNYVFNVANTDAVRVAVVTESQWIRVEDNTDFDAIYGVITDVVTPLAGQTVTADLHAASGWTGSSYTNPRDSAAFAILDTLHEGTQRLLAARPNAPLPKLRVNWSINNRPEAGRQGLRADQQRPLGWCRAVPPRFRGRRYRRVRSAHHHPRVGSLLPSEAKPQRFDGWTARHWRPPSTPVWLGTRDSHRPSVRCCCTRTPYSARSTVRSRGATFRFDIEDNLTNDPSPGWFSEFSVMTLMYDLFDPANEAHDTVELGLGPLYDLIVGDAFSNSPSFLTIFTALEVAKTSMVNQSAGIDTLTEHHSISAVNDIYGVGETNDAGNPAWLPIYTPVEVDGDSVTVALEHPHPGGQSNRLHSNRFLRFSGTGSWVIATTTTSDGPANVLLIYHRGQLLDWSYSPETASETLTIPTQAGEDYIIWVMGYDWSDLGFEVDVNVESL